MMRIVEPVSLVAVLAVMAVCAFKGVSQSALLTALVAALACVPFFLSFELSRPRPRDIMPIAVLAAIAVAGRIVMAPIPNFQPVSAIVILAGVYFGRQSGFLVGAFTALVSNMVLGQGPWTPWQMYAWGLMGYLAGALFSRAAAERPVLGRLKWLIYAYGALSSMVFGVIMDSWFIIGFISKFQPAAVFAAYAAGFALNLSHVLATVVFLLLVLVPWGKKFARIKTKYGIAG